MDSEVLLRALADGEPHSGEELARRFGVTRAAVWKHRAKLEQWGLVVTAVPGLGYRLAQPLDLLVAEAVRAALPRDVASRTAQLEVRTEIGSTNRLLLERAAPPQGELDVCIAEYQHAGRGRRGRAWRTPLGAGLCLSAAWRFAETPPELTALALAVGVAVRRAVAAAAGVDIALKWPNDLVYDGRKLGGILLELEAEAHGGCRVVAGVGLNVAVPASQLAELCDWPRGAIELATARGAPPPQRGALAAALVTELARLFADYAACGFAPYRAEWEAADCLRGVDVTVHDASGTLAGKALGIDAGGALLVATAPGERRRVFSGDVSVRAAR
jgi:BirA family biotin operon repressor/biotin-[acetyl-CoA-carboxylase] ligase